MRGLRGYTAIEIKRRIALRLGYPIDSVKLFGSRINGDWNKDTNLGVAIIDEFKAEDVILPMVCFKIKCEVYFVATFKLSWLKNSI